MELTSLLQYFWKGIYIPGIIYLYSLTHAFCCYGLDSVFMLWLKGEPDCLEILELTADLCSSRECSDHLRSFIVRFALLKQTHMIIYSKNGNRSQPDYLLCKTVIKYRMLVLWNY